MSQSSSTKPEVKSENHGILKPSVSASKLVQDVVASLSAEKEWPHNAIIYSSLEEQELLTDIARGFVVKALLAVHGLQDQYTVERKYNAEFMAPKKGKLPFLRVGNEVLGQEDILSFIQGRQYVLRGDGDITPENDLLMQGVISMIETKLIPIELYVVWMDQANKNKTQERYGYNLPEPLKTILCWQKCKEVTSYLKAIGFLEKSESEIIAELSSIYQCLSRKLGNNRFILGDEMSEADVYVYGHLQAILESKFKNNILMKTLEDYPKLTNFCLNFNQLYLGNKAMIWEFI